MSTFVRNPLIAKMEAVRWSDSPAEDIAELVQYCYDNDLNLHDDFGWEVGVERLVDFNPYYAIVDKLVIVDLNVSDPIYTLYSDNSHPKMIVVFKYGGRPSFLNADATLQSLFKDFYALNQTSGTHGVESLIPACALYNGANSFGYASYTPIAPATHRRFKFYESSVSGSSSSNSRPSMFADRSYNSDAQGNYFTCSIGLYGGTYSIEYNSVAQYAVVYSSGDFNRTACRALGSRYFGVI